MSLRKVRAGAVLALLLPATLLCACTTLMAPLDMLHPDVVFETDSTTVSAIKKSLAIRYLELQPKFAAGIIGFTQDGMIAVHDSSSLDEEGRDELKRLVVEDNKERAALYREIARANGRPDWESQFSHAFGDRWINRAPVGWYYRTRRGAWMRKTAESAKAAEPTVSAPADAPAPAGTPQKNLN